MPKISKELTNVIYISGKSEKIQNFIEKVTMSKEDKKKYDEFLKKASQNPEFKGKKITGMLTVMPENEYDYDEDTGNDNEDEEDMDWYGGDSNHEEPDEVELPEYENQEKLKSMLDDNRDEINKLFNLADKMWDIR